MFVCKEGEGGDMRATYHSLRGLLLNNAITSASPPNKPLCPLNHTLAPSFSWGKGPLIFVGSDMYRNKSHQSVPGAVWPTVVPFPPQSPPSMTVQQRCSALSCCLGASSRASAADNALVHTLPDFSFTGVFAPARGRYGTVSKGEVVLSARGCC